MKGRRVRQNHQGPPPKSHPYNVSIGFRTNVSVLDIYLSVSYHSVIIIHWLDTSQINYNEAPEGVWLISSSLLPLLPWPHLAEPFCHLVKEPPQLSFPATRDPVLLLHPL